MEWSGDESELERWRASRNMVKKITSCRTPTEPVDSKPVSSDEATRGNSSPRSEESISPRTKPTKPYQATVEDYISSDGNDEQPSSREKTAHAGSAPGSRTPLQSSSLVPVAASSGCSTSSLSGPDSDSRPVLKDSNRPSQPKHPARRVHFADRPPPNTSQTFALDGETSQRQSSSRPRGKNDRAKGPGMSPVDLKWGSLFDHHWEPTERLRDVYRGVADYMLENFKPNNSTVLHTQALAEFYSWFQCHGEFVPFKYIFRAKKEDIIELFDYMKCEYHLIPWGPGRPPTWPALTPNGFVEFVEQCIRAAPGNEAERLDMVVQKLPIEAKGFDVDGCRGRVPRQLSRHLFPPRGDETFRNAVAITYESRRIKNRKRAPTVVQDTLPERNTPGDLLYLDPAKHPFKSSSYSPEQPFSSRSNRTSTAYESSRRHIPPNVYVDGEDTPSCHPSRRPPGGSRAAREDEDGYYVQTRRHRSPARHDGTRRRRRDSSPPPRRQSSPPPRRHRNSYSGGARPTDLFRGVSTLQPRHAEHRRHSGDDRRHSADGRQRRRGSREAEYGYYTGSRGGSRRTSAESTPRSSFDSRVSGAGGRIDRYSERPAYEERYGAARGNSYA